MSLDLSPAGRRRLVAPLATTAREAGRVIMTIYDGPLSVRVKSDASPVTNADEQAERLILAALAELAPGIPVVAEEAMSRGHVPTLDGAAFWLVDPLDGTREFINRNGEFTVNIALIVGGAPALGVVYLPAKDILYAGDVGGGAYREDGRGSRITIATRQPPAEGLTVVASRSHNNPETKAYCAQFAVAGYAEAGSSLKFCVVAEGAADLYPRLGRTMEWDTAAGDAVLRAAGGSVTDLNGNPLAYGKAGFENPSFVARGLTT